MPWIFNLYIDIVFSLFQKLLIFLLHFLLLILFTLLFILHLSRWNCLFHHNTFDAKSSSLFITSNTCLKFHFALCDLELPNSLPSWIVTHIFCPKNYLLSLLFLLLDVASFSFIFFCLRKEIYRHLQIRAKSYRSQNLGHDITIQLHSFWIYWQPVSSLP